MVSDRYVFDLVGLGVTGGVHVGDAGVDHLDAGAQQPVDHAVDVALVAGDRVARQDHRVVLADLHPLVLATGQQRQRRHRLALRTGGDDAHLAGRVVVDLVDVDERRVGDLQHAEVAAHAHVLLHAQPERGDDATVGDRRVGDLLDAVQVAGEAGGDDPPAASARRTVRAAPRRRWSRAARGRLLGVGRVGHQQPDALVGRDRADAGEVGAAAVDRREVELEVAGVQDDTLRRVHRDRVGVRHRVGDGDELDVERADHPPLAVLDDDQVGLAQQPGLLDAVAGQAERDRRAVDREAQFAQQVLQRADVVLVAVGGDDALDAVGVLAQPREVGQDEIDAVHVGVGEHQPAVDQQHLALLLDGHAVAADLTETAEEDDANGISHQ